MRVNVINLLQVYVRNTLLIKLGDPPAFPTPIYPCPKCKKSEGWTWHYSNFGKDQSGHATCNGCNAKQ